MAVPTPTATYLDLTDGTFAEVGSPVIIDGPVGPNRAYSTDGLSDALTSTEKPFPGSGGAAQSCSFYFNRDSAPSGFEQVLCQYDNTVSATQAFFIGINGASNFIMDFRTSGVGVRTNFTDSSGFVYDSTYHHYIATIDGSDGELYRDGVPQGPVITPTGGGFAGFPSTVATLTLSATENILQFGENKLARLKFWSGTELTAAQALEEFNNENALLGTGFSNKSPITVSMYPDNGFFSGLINRDLYKKS